MEQREPGEMLRGRNRGEIWVGVEVGEGRVGDMWADDMHNSLLREGEERKFL